MLTIDYLITNFRGLKDILVILLILLGLLVFHIDFIHGQLMRKQSVTLEESFLRCKTLFSDKVIDWDKIESSQRYVNRGVVSLDIMGYVKMDEIFLKPIMLRIVLDKFNLSEERLKNTIEKMRTITQLNQ